MYVSVQLHVAKHREMKRKTVSKWEEVRGRGGERERGRSMQRHSRAMLEITAMRKAKGTKEGKGRTARNIRLEYRRRRTGCGLTKNAHLKRIALLCVKENPLWFYVCLPSFASILISLHYDSRRNLPIFWRQKFSEIRWTLWQTVNNWIDMVKIMQARMYGSRLGASNLAKPCYC